MNEALAIRIQAHLDGELSQEASKQLLAELGNNPEGKEFLAALQAESKLLNSLPEIEHSLPVAHGYFWQGIFEFLQCLIVLRCCVVHRPILSVSWFRSVDAECFNGCWPICAAILASTSHMARRRASFTFSRIGSFLS